MQRMNVKKIVNHWNWNHWKYWTENNDFALLKLQKAVDYCAHTHIRPICLPTDTSQTFAGVEAIKTGWGRTSSGGSSSTTLLEVTVKVLSNEKCKRHYRPNQDKITTKMLCEHSSGGGKASCQVNILQSGWVL